jgi:AcrR family transcriptional regulator
VKTAARKTRRRKQRPGHRNSASKSDPRAIRSSQALTDAFLKLLEAKPLQQISVRDIVAVAGVGYTTFFRHHASKEELLDHVAADQIRRLFDLAMPDLDAYDVHSGSMALFAYVDAHRALWSTLLTGGAAGTIREEFRRLAGGVAASQGRPHSWLPADAGAVLIVGGTLDLLGWWLRQTRPLPIERIVEIHESVVVAPVIEASSTTRHRASKRRSASR